MVSSESVAIASSEVRSLKAALISPSAHFERMRLGRSLGVLWCCVEVCVLLVCCDVVWCGGKVSVAMSVLMCEACVMC